MPGKDRILAFSELQLYANGDNNDNVARKNGVKAIQSSTLLPQYEASNAIDDTANTTERRNVITQTELEDNPWWKIDLGINRAISKVVLWNRQDCCTEGLSGATIGLLGSDGNPTKEMTIGDSTGITKFGIYFSPNDTPTPKLDQTRYVRVSLEGDNKILCLSGKHTPVLKCFGS